MGGKSGGGITGYKYYIGMHLALCHGPIDELQMITVGEREAWSGNSSGGQISIDAPELFGGDDREGGVSGEVDVLMGNPSPGKKRLPSGAIWQYRPGISWHRLSDTASVLHR